jgi:hypothetical protein
MQAGAGSFIGVESLLPAGMSEVWHAFLESWYKPSGLYKCRGTRLIGAANLSPFTKLVVGTGAVSRYKLSLEPENSLGAGF